MKVRRRDITCTMIRQYSQCIPDNITIIPNYRIKDSLSDQVPRCSY